MKKNSRNDLSKKLDEVADNILNFSPEDDMQDTADYIHTVYESYVKAGFSGEQAFELAKIVLDNSMKIGGLFE